MSGRITAVSLEFNQCFSSFASKTYDVLDPDDESFKGDFLKFQERILVTITVDAHVNVLRTKAHLLFLPTQITMIIRNLI